MKRLFDILLSLAALALLLPLLALIAFVVWIDSGRPIFFAQERVGLNFRPFRMWKFRSMRSVGDGPLITVNGDRRVTRVGVVLRALKLDELPQFWNVLRGDMSLVGPRPEVAPYVEVYRDRYAAILTVRPGITDLASLAYRDEEKVLAAQPDPQRFYCEVILPAKLDLADRYIGTRSLAMDAGILVRTFVAALRS